MAPPFCPTIPLFKAFLGVGVGHNGHGRLKKAPNQASGPAVHCNSGGGGPFEPVRIRGGGVWKTVGGGVGAAGLRGHNRENQ